MWLGGDGRQRQPILKNPRWKPRKFRVFFDNCLLSLHQSGIYKGMLSRKNPDKAVECGYWPLYRYNPLLKAEGKNPFQLESKEPNGKLMEFLDGEVRYATLKKSFPEESEKLRKALSEEVIERYQKYKRMAEES